MLGVSLINDSARTAFEPQSSAMCATRIKTQRQWLHEELLHRLAQKVRLRCTPQETRRFFTCSAPFLEETIPRRPVVQFLRSKKLSGVFRRCWYTNICHRFSTTPKSIPSWHTSSSETVIGPAMGSRHCSG